MAKRTRLSGGTVPADERDVQRVLRELGRMYVCRVEDGVRVCRPRFHGQVRLARLWSRRLYDKLPIRVRLVLEEADRMSDDGTMACEPVFLRRRRRRGRLTRTAAAACTLRLRAQSVPTIQPKADFLEAAYGPLIRHELTHAVQFSRRFDLERRASAASSGPWHLRPEEVEAILAESERELRHALSIFPASFRPEVALRILRTSFATSRWERESPRNYRRALQMSARVLAEQRRVQALRGGR